jgi:pimeloyl-ACP methyl ester carboxylesterase
MKVRSITADNEGIILAGSLWEPPGIPAALLLMHPGSGPSDRDNDVLFPPIRATLLAAGIAVCSFDKRGVGESGGSWLTADIHTQATDLAVSLAAARAALPDVRAGLFGHSQGGWVVLEALHQVAADFVVTNSGPGVSPRVQEIFSTGNQLDRLPLSADGRAAAVAVFADLMELVGRRVPYRTAAAWLAEPTRADALAALVDAGAFVPDEESLWNFAMMLIDHDPVPALQQVRVPLLAMFGGQDMVVPVAASVQRYRAAVPEPLLNVRVLPGGDHRMQTGDDDAFVPGYLDELVGFISSVVG